MLNQYFMSADAQNNIFSTYVRTMNKEYADFTLQCEKMTNSKVHLSSHHAFPHTQTHVTATSAGELEYVIDHARVEDGRERLHIKGFIRGVVTACVCVRWGSLRLFTQLGSTLSRNPTSRCPPKHVPLQEQKTPIFSLFIVIINSLLEGKGGAAETAHFSHCVFVLRLRAASQSKNALLGYGPYERIFSKPHGFGQIHCVSESKPTRDYLG